MIGYAVRAVTCALTVLYTATTLYACAPERYHMVQNPVRNVPLEQESNIVNILQSRADISRPLQEAIDLYASSNPDAHINVQTVANVSDYRVALRAKLLSREQVDVFQFFSNQEAAELKPRLENLSGLEWIEGAVEETLDAARLDGGIYGIPYAIEGYGLVANRNIFEAADIPLGGIVSFSDLEEAFAALKEKIDAGEMAEDFPLLKTVTDFAMQDKYFLGEIVANTVLLGAFSSPTQAALGTGLNYPHGDAAEEFIRLLVKHSPKTDWEKTEGIPASAQVEALADGKCAILLGDIGMYSQIYEQNPQLRNRLALIPIPLRGAEESVIFTGAPLYWAIGADSTDMSKQSAKRFLTWLYQSESGTAVIAGRFRAISPYRATAKDTGVPIQTQAVSLIEKGRSRPVLYREFPHGWGTDSFAKGLRACIAGETQWKDFLTESAGQWARERMQIIS